MIFRNLDMNWCHFLLMSALHFLFLERRKFCKFRWWCLFLLFFFLFIRANLLLHNFFLFFIFFICWISMNWNFPFFYWFLELLWHWNFRSTLWMSLKKDLTWCLTELCNLHLECRSLDRVLKFFQINSSLVCDWMENVEMLNRTLVDPEYKINPVVDILGYIITF